MNFVTMIGTFDSIANQSSVSKVKGITGLGIKIHTIGDFLNAHHLGESIWISNRF